MVRAILDGSKTQTRRMVNPQPFDGFYPENGGIAREYSPLRVDKKTGEAFCGGDLFGVSDADQDFPSVYGRIGERLWVKETHGFWCHSFNDVGVEYAAGGDDKIVNFQDKSGMPSLEVQCRKNIGGGRRKRPSIFMPRWASRITLEIVAVRVERLQDIGDLDACAEGSLGPFPTFQNGEIGEGGPESFVAGYRELWESINGKGSWVKNPWVWCLTFKRV
jgi:hypothetical protein